MEARRFEFDEDTEVTPAPGGFRGTITDRWDILGGRPNGGYLLAVATRALAGAVHHPDPVTVTGHFLRPPAAGPVDIGIEVLREGRGHTTAMAALRQEGREFLRVIATFGDLAAASGPTAVAAVPPVVPSPESCVDARETPMPTWKEPPPFFHRLDLRLSSPAAAGDILGLVQGWVRFADGRPPDVLSLPLFADAYPPAVFSVAPAAWVPTVELTVHVRARPAEGWLTGSFRTRFLVKGYLEEDGELWDSTGRLVALSRQLAMTRGPVDVGAGTR